MLTEPNFYDNINLSILEKKIREVIGSDKSCIVDLLFHFLGYWDREVLGYNRKTVGIPQELIGDSSRLLANFYLQDYDNFIADKSKLRNINYLRYCDDQLFFANEECDVRDIVYIASSYLSKIGLNINAQKVEYFSCTDFENKKFDINFSENISLMIEEIDSHKDSLNINKAQKRLLNLINKSLEPIACFKKNVFNIVVDPNFLLSCKKSHEIRVVSELCNRLQIEIKEDYVKYIEGCYDESQILNFSNTIPTLEEVCKKRLSYLNMICE